MLVELKNSLLLMQVGQVVGTFQTPPGRQVKFQFNWDLSSAKNMELFAQE